MLRVGSSFLLDPTPTQVPSLTSKKCIHILDGLGKRWGNLGETELVLGEKMGAFEELFAMEIVESKDKFRKLDLDFVVYSYDMSFIS